MSALAPNHGSTGERKLMTRLTRPRRIRYLQVSSTWHERAISVSGYIYRGLVKYTDHAFNKIATYKRRSRNHLIDQIENFRVGDKDNKRGDDLLDTFCYGIALSLGNQEGF